MSLGTLVLIAFTLLLIGGIGGWSRNGDQYGGLGGGLGLAVFALPVLLLTGRL